MIAKRDKRLSYGGSPYRIQLRSTFAENWYLMKSFSKCGGKFAYNLSSDLVLAYYYLVYCGVGLCYHLRMPPNVQTSFPLGASASLEILHFVCVRTRLEV